MRSWDGHRRRSSIAAASVCALVFALVAGLSRSSGAGADQSAPTSPPVQVCGNAGLLTGPASPPAGAVTVPAGDNSALNLDQASTTYWFAPGTHTLGTGEYDQITPSDDSTYIGAPGAIIDGENLNDYAFTQTATNVTIEYLTIQNFGQTGGNNNEGVVNHDSGSNWTIEHNTIQGNAGAGVMLGTDDVLEYNCLTENGQYGFSAYTPTGPSDITVSYNEISYNDTYNWEVADPGCGCSGGGKFWDTDVANIIDNYIHDNYSVGVWADTDNVGFTITGNYISGNAGQAIIYEISYNALIADNTLLDNLWTEGPQNDDFPDGAIYISESGGDSRVPGPYSGSLSIQDNVFTNNWSGITLWENANRFCNSPDNTSTGYCTLVNPAINSSTMTTTCAPPAIDSAPNYSDCRWKTQNVSVTGNIFSFDPAAIPGCTPSTQSCGMQGLFSNYGDDPSWSPYQGEVIEDGITSAQNDTFSDNTYVGPWQFMAHDQSVIVDFSTWQSTYGQDAGSTYDSEPIPTSVPGAPTSLTAMAGDGQVLLNWTAPLNSGGADLTGYDILRGTTSGGESSTPIATVTSGTTYTDTGLTDGSTYYYEVEALNSVGPSSPSNEASATPTAVTTTMSATTLSTSLSGDGQSGTTITVPPGTDVVDQATLSGPNVSRAAGTVTYTVYKRSLLHHSGWFSTLGWLSLQLLATGGTVDVTDGFVPASSPVPLDSGIYFWQATYSGDALNGPSQSGLRSEEVIALDNPSDSASAPDPSPSPDATPSPVVPGWRPFVMIRTPGHRRPWD